MATKADFCITYCPLCPGQKATLKRAAKSTAEAKWLVCSMSALEVVTSHTTTWRWRVFVVRIRETFAFTDTATSNQEYVIKKVANGVCTEAKWKNVR